MVGGTFGGAAGGFTYGGENGAQLTGSHEPVEPVKPRGFGYGGVVGGLYAPGAGDVGGTYGISSKSIDGLLADSDGWALILERADGERRAFSASEDPHNDLISLSITLEVNNLSDWRVELPPDPALYEWSFARAVIGYNGERIFHGIVLPASGDHGGSVELGGFGSLWHATHGSIDVSYSGIRAWQAINDCWQRTADVSDGEIRGYAIRPPPEHETYIPGGEDAIEVSGTPLSCLKELHSFAGMAFTLDHGDEAAVAISFTPGEQHRTLNWRAEDYSVDVDPTGYYNKVTVTGAKAPPAYPRERFRGAAKASDMEIREVTNGNIIEYPMTVPEAGSPGACEARAESKLAELRANYSVTGSVDILPARATPGFVYRVPEFDKAAPEVFAPVELPLQSVEHSFGVGEASTSLSFETPEGVVGAIREMQSRNSPTAMLQDSDYPNGTGIGAWGEGAWGAGVWGGSQ